MGMTPVGAAALKTPQFDNPLDEYQRVVGLKNALLQNQSGQLQVAQQQRSAQDDEAWRSVMSDPNWDGTPQDLLKRGLAAGVGPQSYTQMAGHVQEMQKNAAALTETQLKNQQTMNDQYRGRLLSIVNGPAAQKQASWDSEITKEEQSGQIKPGAITHQYPGDDVATTFANQLSLGSVLAKEAIDNKTAGARQQQADTSASLAPSEIAKNTAQANLETNQLATAGQVTDKDKYVQSQENMRAALGRQAANANELQRQGITNLQKQSDTYTQYLSTANSLKNSLQAAQDGNQLAAAVAPLQGTLFITTSEGVKRINETELQGVAGAGSLVQRIEGSLGKLSGGGPLSPQLKDDMGKLVDLYTNAKYGQYQKQAQYTQKLHGLDSNTTPILDQTGNITNAGAAGTKPNNDPLGIR